MARRDGEEFMTQEDILLFPCAEWVYLECSRLLQIKFVEPPLDYITYHDFRPNFSF